MTYACLCDSTATDRPGALDVHQAEEGSVTDDNAPAAGAAGCQDRADRMATCALEPSKTEKDYVKELVRDGKPVKFDCAGLIEHFPDACYNDDLVDEREVACKQAMGLPASEGDPTSRGCSAANEEFVLKYAAGTHIAAAGAVDADDWWNFMTESSGSHYSRSPPHVRGLCPVSVDADAGGSLIGTVQVQAGLGFTETGANMAAGRCLVVHDYDGARIASALPTVIKTEFTAAITGEIDAEKKQERFSCGVRRGGRGERRGGQSDGRRNAARARACCRKRQFTIRDCTLTPRPKAQAVADAEAPPGVRRRRPVVSKRRFRRRARSRRLQESVDYRHEDHAADAAAPPRRNWRQRLAEQEEAPEGDRAASPASSKDQEPSGGDGEPITEPDRAPTTRARYPTEGNPTTAPNPTTHGRPAPKETMPKATVRRADRLRRPVGERRAPRSFGRRASGRGGAGGHTDRMPERESPWRTTVNS